MPAGNTFFENQHLARRNTKILVLMYLLAVIGVIIAVDLVLAGSYAYNFVYAPPGKSLTLAARLRAVPASILMRSALTSPITR